MGRLIVLGVLVLGILAGCGAVDPAATTTPPAAAATETQAAAMTTETMAAATETQAAPSSALDAATTGALQGQTLRLATTTSTADSGLLDAILPDFEQQTGATVEVIAVGTGQALTLGKNGDVDVVLVHDQAREDQFVSEGSGVDRRDVMYNDFVIVGPRADAAKAEQTTSAADAAQNIAKAQANFVSRGDSSGTHAKELSLWKAANLAPEGQPWYRSIGQGMSEALLAANELQAYTLSDRGTYLALRDKLPGLGIVFGGATAANNPDATLRNSYGVIAVNPAQHPGINAELATAFIDWLTSEPVQAQIGAFGTDRFGQPLFYPHSAP